MHPMRGKRSLSVPARRAGVPARRRQVRAPPALPALARRAASAALWGAGVGCDRGRRPGDSGSPGKGTAGQQNHL